MDSSAVEALRQKVATANAAVSSINKFELTQVRDLPFPPKVVTTTTEAILVLVGSESTTWPTAQEFLSTNDYPAKIAAIDPKNTPKEKLEELKAKLGKTNDEEVMLAANASLPLYQAACAYVELGLALHA